MKGRNREEGDVARVEPLIFAPTLEVRHWQEEKGGRKRKA